MSEIKQALTEQIATEFLDGQTGDLSNQTRLVEDEIIDSLGIFLLLGFIKERFGVEVDPEDVTLENFATIDDIADLIEEKRVGA